MLDRLEAIASELESRLKPKKRAGKTITLKIKYSDFRLHTRSKTLPYFISDASMILEIAKELLYQEPLQNSVRLLGISLSNLNTEKDVAEPPEDSVQVQLKFEF
jgi:DNA polymerase-4